MQQDPLVFEHLSHIKHNQLVLSSVPGDLSEQVYAEKLKAQAVLLDYIKSME